jgi:S1-C subfamily serine protease
VRLSVHSSMKRRKLLELALTSVENGRVSVEELLRAALSRGDGFEDWLAAKVSKWPDHQFRRPLIRAPQRIPPTLPDVAVRRARRRFGKLPGVTSVHWGLLRRRGFYSGRSGVVLFVEKKLPRELLAPQQAYPRQLEVSYRGRRHRIPIDVQAPGEPAHRHAIDQARPGARTVVRAAQQGMLSAIIPAADGKVRALLSGHVAGTQGQAVTLVALDGTDLKLTIERLEDDRFNDLAATTPFAASDESRFSSFPVQVRDPVKSESGHVVTIVTDRGAMQTTITDVGVSASFDDGSSMDDLFSTPAQTNHGESGSPTFDQAGNLIGFVVGGPAEKTYLLPARRAINALF